MTREQAEKEIRSNFSEAWAEEIIKALQEQRPKGHWIKIGNNQPMSCDDLYTCSECHKGKYIDPKGINFCENCGADMRDNPITIPYADSQGLEFADTPTLASAT